MNFKHYAKFIYAKYLWMDNLKLLAITYVLECYESKWFHEDFTDLADLHILLIKHMQYAIVVCNIKVFQTMWLDSINIFWIWISYSIKILKLYTIWLIIPLYMHFKETAYNISYPLKYLFYRFLIRWITMFINS